MIFGVVVRNVDSPKRWVEKVDWPHVQTLEEAQKIAQETMLIFNNLASKRKEKERILVGLSILHPEESKEHDWYKINLVTVMGSRGQGAHDVYKCLACGITGKRFGLQSNVTRDKQFQNDEYADCSKAQQLRGRK